MPHRTSPLFHRPSVTGSLALLGLLACVATAHAQTPPAAAPATGCEVMSSGQLRSNEFIPSYEGGCAKGVAQGAGKAIWHKRYSPEAQPIVWQGRFAQGVFLPESQIVGVKPVDRTRVLFDLGALQGAKGAQAGRLWVESRVDGLRPASACAPISLQVSTHGALAEDAAAKSWLNAAYDRWSTLCAKAGEPAQQRRGNLRVQLHAGADWAPDTYGNLPGSVVQAVRPFPNHDDAKAASEWQQYTNRAAQAVAHQQREKQRSDEQKQLSIELQANQDRIRAFARKTGATRYVELSALKKNPFRFGDEVILVAVRVLAALTPEEAVAGTANRSRHDWSRVLLRGPIAQWDEQGRVVAVRVKGRSTEEHTRDAVIVELVDSRRCEKADCEDYLYMPGKRWLQEDAPITGDANDQKS
ncbi:hypothetical protein [Diaphorobacter sp.]|uniref:hypothetical protein n=1 Tax=Diaphorobacter sp. TaxID=1934310 RepID=UPI0028B06540|nr:hypothetical protein [Diaphorobacter sp.]